ncbi:hypothetical protein FANTH_14777 [Fusarium anthophilum]|uniref:Uncharacterized protein n=1 Tax=Fusarium anthophilum TaxID=48485 RepID=A0A8H5DKX0_9HYPO|nr:hypothetical protein FANTH_14777 [Fusarium anthophilum]
MALAGSRSITGFMPAVAPTLRPTIIPPCRLQEAEYFAVSMAANEAPGWFIPTSRLVVMSKMRRKLGKNRSIHIRAESANVDFAKQYGRIVGVGEAASLAPKALQSRSLFVGAAMGTAFGSDHPGL